MENSIRDNAKAVLAKIIFNIDYSLRQPTESMLLKSFTNEVEDIHLMLLDDVKIRQQCAARIIIFIGSGNPCLLINSCKYLFQNAKTDDHLALLVRIISNELIDKTLQPYCDKGGYFSAVLEDVLGKNSEDINALQEGNVIDMAQMWANLLTLLRYFVHMRIVMGAINYYFVADGSIHVKYKY